MKYTIEIGDESIEVDVRALSAGRYSVRVGDGPGRVVDARVEGSLAHVIEGQRTRAVAKGARADGWHVQANGLSAQATVLDARAARLRARRGGALAGGGDTTVRTPMPGRVVKVMVAPGDAVEVGQGVVIVEAMKMENELRAALAGTVKAVHVSAGETVEGNAPLVEIEAVDAERS